MGAGTPAPPQITLDFRPYAGFTSSFAAPAAGRHQVSVWDRFTQGQDMLTVDRSRRMTCAVLCLSAIAAFAPKALAADDPDELLTRIRALMMKHLSQLPNYTCHEVIDRAVRPRTGSFQHLDRVELEVAFTGHGELFAKTADAQFEEQPVFNMVPAGTIASSPMGSHVDGIFAANLAEFKFAGTAKRDGHKTFRFDFHVPQEKSQYLVRHNSVEAIVAFKGSIWVDADTLDLVRVDLKTDHIPPRVGVLVVEESMHYDLMHIGNSDFLLPQHSDLMTTDDSGNYSLNDVRLENCREFVGQSVVTYGAPQASRQVPKQP